MSIFIISAFAGKPCHLSLPFREEGAATPLPMGGLGAYTPSYLSPPHGSSSNRSGRTRWTFIKACLLEDEDTPLQIFISEFLFQKEAWCIWTRRLRKKVSLEAAGKDRVFVFVK